MAQKTIVGLDIGTTRLRAVEAIMQNNTPKVISIASTVLPENVVIGGEVKDIPKFTEALKALWKNGKFTSDSARVVVNSETNIARLATLDDELDFEKTLPFRLQSKISISSEKYYISYHTLRKYEIQETDSTIVGGLKTVPKRDIFLACAERTSIDNILEAFKNADLRLLSVDLAPLALIRGESDVSDYPEEDEIDIHVNIGGDTTTIVIANHSQPVYVRVIDIGGNGITEAIADELDISYEYAEKLKLDTLTMNPTLTERQVKQGAFFNGGAEVETANADLEEYTEDQLEAFKIVNEELGAIINNISTTIMFFIDGNQFGLGNNINHVYLSGGTSNFKKIQHHLIHEVGANETLRSSPIEHLEHKGFIDGKLAEKFLPHQHELTLAIGAILGKGGNRDA